MTGWKEGTMITLYKFLDEKTYELLRNDHMLSLSRPLFEFKSEGQGFKLLREICYKIENGESLDFGREDKKLIKMVKEWIQGYRKTISEEYGEDYSDADIRSDLYIMLTQYFLAYCGYFTRTDLENPEIRKHYFENNKRIAENRVLIKITLDSKQLDGKKWAAKDGDKWVFYCASDENTRMGYGKISGTLHSHTIEYNGSNKLFDSLKAFNGVDKRKISSFLKYVNPKYNMQEEERLVLHLSSNHPNECISAFSMQSNVAIMESFEEKLQNDIVYICQEALKCPKYVYLYVEKYETLDV